MYTYIKRLIDIILSFLGMLLLSPVYIVVVLIIKLDSKGPVLFKQKRVGRNKELFNILKFRTMRIDAPKDTPTHLLGDSSKYITRIGKYMRQTSLDELPQFWNIFVGNMSIIGPRPALWNQTDLIEERDKYGANNIRPGLTGWAQVNGRDELSIEVKARYDGEYVNMCSFSTDVRLFITTIFKVLRTEDVVEGRVEKNENKELVIQCEKELSETRKI